jgi:hypothetical protein
MASQAATALIISDWEAPVFDAEVLTLAAQSYIDKGSSLISEVNTYVYGYLIMD